jgi:ABC-2 type transport system permease protein
MIRREIVGAFLAHEMRDLRSNRGVVPILLVLPLLGLVLPAAIAATGKLLVEQAAGDPGTRAVLEAALRQPEFAGLDMAEALIRYALRAVVGFYLLMPAIIAGTASAFSIVGEKQQRTLEPILATPISDREFLLGKFLVCLVPTVALTWATAVVAILLVDGITLLRMGAIVLPDRFWMAGVGLLAPLLGGAVVLLTMRLSARSVDPQATVQTSGLAIVPGFLVVFGLFGKLLISSFPALLVAIALAALLDLWLFRRVERTFEREEILTRWK